MNNNSTIKMYVDGALFCILYSVVEVLNRLMDLTMNTGVVIGITLVLWVIISLVIKRVMVSYKNKKIG